jgi:hypothetical protein
MVLNESSELLGLTEAGYGLTTGKCHVLNKETKTVS